MEILEKNGHIKSMTVAVNLSPIEMLPDEVKPSVIEKCIGGYISSVLKKEPAIKELFDKAACDLILKEIVKDLDLKPSEDFEPTSKDLFAKSVAEALFKNMFKE